MNDYVIAIDQGTTSTRAILFDHAGSIVSTGQLEHEQIFTQAGWVEHDPKEIWNNTREVIGQALSKANVTRHNVKAIGITNQRETAVVWNKTTGEPVYNAIVWQDTRTQKIVDRLADGDTDRYKSKVGLPLMKESRLNHLGKLMFQWFYWHVLLPGRDVPGVGADMPTAGKQTASAEAASD